MAKKKSFIDSDLVAPLLIMVLGLFALIFSITFFVGDISGSFSVVGSVEEPQTNYDTLIQGCSNSGVSTEESLIESLGSQRYFSILESNRVVSYEGGYYICPQ